MARKKHEVQNDLQTAVGKVKEFAAATDKQTELNAAREDVQKFTTELNAIIIDDAAERSLAAANAVSSKEVQAAAKHFSICKLLSQAASGRLDGVELEMSQEAAKEAQKSGITPSSTAVGIPYFLLQAKKGVGVRSVGDDPFDGQDVTTPAKGGLLVNTELQYQEALLNRLALARAGARFIGGLTSNLDLIQGNPVTMGWLGENTAGTDTAKTFTSRNVGPKRAFVNVPISLQLMVQGSYDVERIVMDTINAAHGQLLDTAGLAGDGTNNSPLGLLYDPDIAVKAIGPNGGPLAWGTVVDLETAIGNQNADVSGMSYITNSKVRGVAKQTLRASGVSGYILEGETMNGYGTHVTNILPSNLTKGTATNCSPLVMGNFNDLHVLQWGGLFFVVDPYSRKKEGATEITLNCYHNIFLQRKESFAICKDITT